MRTRNCVVSMVGLALLVVLGVAPPARAAAYDISNCSTANADLIRKAVDGALQRLSLVENGRPEVVRGIMVQSFGDWSADPDQATLLAAVLAAKIYNTRVLLAGGTPINPLGPPPTLPRVTFSCTPGPAPDIARYVGNGRVNLYEQLFFQLPFTASYWSAQGTRVGTILHEMIHVMGGPADISVGGAANNVSAARLAENRDPRAFNNAENYEMFYMSF